MYFVYGQSWAWYFYIRIDWWGRRASSGYRNISRGPEAYHKQISSSTVRNKETFHILVKKIFSLSEMNTYQAQTELQKINNTEVKK